MALKRNKKMWQRNVQNGERKKKPANKNLFQLFFSNLKRYFAVFDGCFQLIF